METCAAINKPDELFRLITSLERQGGNGLNGGQEDSGPLRGVVTVRSQEDPSERVAFAIPSEPPGGMAAHQRWLTEHKSALTGIIDNQRLARCTVVMPGDQPEKPVRDRVGRCAVRLVSATYHLWAERFRLHDERGDLDERARQVFLEDLAPKWSGEEERHYTEAALAAVSESDGNAIRARQLMMRTSPDLPSGTVTVVFGPGGIGKTYFLRRLANRMMRAAKQDRLLPVPVFAELPVLLHGDALENWIANRGPKLPIDQIRTLISHGVIVPILDALDELVRGQARDGTREFLEHVSKLARRDARVLLSSRDYYLNLDPLVHDGLGEAATEMKIGYFSKAGRRRYIQMRTGLEADGAARWAGQLEEQSRGVLSNLADDDVEALIGHPLFLDAFCKMIGSVPEERRVAAADEFRISSPNVFGDIVTSVLEREERKFMPNWENIFNGRLVGTWSAPFAPDLQRRVLRELVLLVAQDGGGEVLQREREDPRYRELRHGVFTFTKGMDEDADTRSAIRSLLRRFLGEPELAAGVSDEEAEALVEQAVDNLADFYEQHTLADTRPDLVDDLVFATRHRAYFDYLLADALLDRLYRTLTRATADASVEFVDWCLAHHIFERTDSAEAEPPYSSCLDFVLWHRESMSRALDLVDAMFVEVPGPDATIASYVASLALAVNLRAGVQSGRSEISDRAVNVGDGELEILASIVPLVTDCTIERCTFPDVMLRDIEMRDTVFYETEFDEMRVESCVLRRVRFEESQVDRATFTGALTAQGCVLGLEVDADRIFIDPRAEIQIFNSQLSGSLLEGLQQARRINPEAIRLENCSAIPVPDTEQFTAGRFFLNKLMALTRRHGRDAFAVYSYKLRGRTRATGNTFGEAVHILREHGAIVEDGDLIKLSEEAADNRYSGRMLKGLRGFDDVAEFWQPVVSALDEVFESG